MRRLLYICALLLAGCVMAGDVRLRVSPPTLNVDGTPAEPAALVYRIDDVTVASGATNATQLWTGTATNCVLVGLPFGWHTFAARCSYTNAVYWSDYSEFARWRIWVRPGKPEKLRAEAAQ